MSMGAKYTAAPGYDGRSYRDVPKRFWNERQWREYVADAEGFLERVAKRFPQHYSVADWTAILATRRNEMILAGHDPSVSI